eukprot:169346-Chlamydomonas_euryale.AAC.1
MARHGHATTCPTLSAPHCEETHSPMTFLYIGFDLSALRTSAAMTRRERRAPPAPRPPPPLRPPGPPNNEPATLSSACCCRRSHV